LTYGMAALRRCLYLTAPTTVGPIPQLFPSLLITLLFAFGSFLLAAYTARRHQ